jgi:hypothetical protein
MTTHIIMATTSPMGMITSMHTLTIIVKAMRTPMNMPTTMGTKLVFMIRSTPRILIAGRLRFALTFKCNDQ